MTPSSVVSALEEFGGASDTMGCTFETWAMSRVVKDLANLADRTVQALLEVNERVIRPKLALKLLPGHHFPGTFQQRGQHLERLLLNFEPDTVFTDLAALQIGLEGAKFDEPSLRKDKTAPSQGDVLPQL
jgi:hypothetical protein